MTQLDLCYQFISTEYGTRRASRSGVLLINHIDEGLAILSNLGADDETKAAYCLHPLIQDLLGVNEIQDTMDRYVEDGVFPSVLKLALQYSYAANQYLCHNWTHSYTVDDIMDPPKFVDLMLIADKVQNRKDFELYHKGTHSRSASLDKYFKTWLQKLGISESQYEYLVVKMTTSDSNG